MMSDNQSKIKTVLVTGGAGFIGCNLAEAWLSYGAQVRILDNFCRPGVNNNIEWLKRLPGVKKRLLVIKGDVREKETVEAAVKGVNVICHEAGQTAVTTSLVDPWADFDTNARGTVTVLEAMRQLAPNATLIYASTNKVYGNLTQWDIRESETRYEAMKAKAVTEMEPLDFYSPYGCSKGTADQYVHDYARSFGLKTVVFRQSCIYGDHQIGVEDQGWVAHFVSQALKHQPITIYGNGKQVRDILYIKDLVEAYVKAIEKIEVTRGQIYNIGGGISNTTSLIELIKELEILIGYSIELNYKAERLGDQKYFVSDTNKALRDFGWQPTTSIRIGLQKLVDWLKK